MKAPAEISRSERSGPLGSEATIPPAGAAPDDLLACTLRAIEQDGGAGAARAFADASAEYLAAAARAEGPVRAASNAGQRCDSAPASPLPWSGAPLERVIERLRSEVLACSLRLSHPRYLGPPVAPPLPAACWAEALIGALNQSLVAEPMSPTGTPLERELIAAFAARAGYGPGAGGIFTSGASEGNFTGLLAARATGDPRGFTEGVSRDPGFVFCGDNAHSSVPRAAGLLGIGTARVMRVPLKRWRMDPERLAADLARASSEGQRVLAVVATAGAPATGAIDDLDAIASVCEGFGAWLHVDAALCGAALLSGRHRSRLAGIERSHSISWDAHKMMGVPLSASVLLLRDERALDAAFADSSVSGSDDRNPYGRGFMTSRRFDALKVWVVLQRYGVGGLGALYDHLCRLTQTLYLELLGRKDFEVLHQPDANVLSFRYLGRAAGRGEAALEAMNRAILARLLAEGEWFIAASQVDGIWGLRATLMNPRTRPEHLWQLLAAIEVAAEQAAQAARIEPIAPAREAP